MHLLMLKVPICLIWFSFVKGSQNDSGFCLSIVWLGWPSNGKAWTCSFPWAATRVKAIAISHGDCSWTSAPRIRMLPVLFATVDLAPTPVTDKKQRRSLRRKLQFSEMELSFQDNLTSIFFIYCYRTNNSHVIKNYHLGLRRTHIYYLMVSVNQEYRFNLSMSSALETPKSWSQGVS